MTISRFHLWSSGGGTHTVQNQHHCHQRQSSRWLWSLSSMSWSMIDESTSSRRDHLRWLSFSLQCPTLTHLIILIILLFIQPIITNGDWAQSNANEYVRTIPGSEFQAQNPPSFAWTRHSTYPSNYVIEVATYRGGPQVGPNSLTDRPQDIVYTFNTTRPWYLPSKIFPLGTYAWHVRPDPLIYTNGVPDWSDWRIFQLTGDALRWEVPEIDQIRSHILAKSRPRSLPDGFKTVSQWDAVQSAAQKTALQVDIANVLSHSFVAFPTSESQFDQYHSHTDPAYNNVSTAMYQLIDAALLWRLQGQQFHLLEAFRRGDQIASLDPYGKTGYLVQDQFCRSIAFNLIRGIDLLYDVIDPARKQRWLDVVVLRTNDLFADFTDDTNTLEQQPYDSHGSNAIEYMATISHLALGETDSAEVWFNFCGRFIFHYIMPWSGSDGGYANGESYGEVAMSYFMEMWPTIATATGVNLFHKPYAIGFMKQFIYFVPPHSQTHVFGDGQEATPSWEIIRGFAQRLNDQEAAWYAQQLAYYSFQEAGTSFLSAHFPMQYMSVTPKVPDNAIHMRSIGWTAMHSDITDPLRTSIYFHSQPGPWGTYNHAHGNQNAFLLNSNGRKLLVDSGWYDSYYSTEGVTWYRTTKATNAITYDGGIGVQTIEGNTVNQYKAGQITDFSHTTDLDSVSGDATLAYAYVWPDPITGIQQFNYNLTSIIRRLWYLRTENVVIIQDLIKAPLKHSFEWNFHALAPISNNGNSSVWFTNIDTSLCITSLTTDPIQYINRTWPNPPSYEQQPIYHGAFIKPNTNATEFLMVLDVGCRKSPVTVQEMTHTRKVTIGTQTVIMRK